VRQRSTGQDEWILSAECLVGLPPTGFRARYAACRLYPPLDGDLQGVKCLWGRQCGRLSACRFSILDGPDRYVNDVLSGPAGLLKSRAAG
jgi:hypothetical protein